MTVTTSTSSGISQRTNVYAERQMLKHAGPTMILDKTAMAKQMPRNKSLTMKFRRPIVFTEADTPLVEGVTPSATAFSYEDVSVTLKQYGQVVIVTDVIEDTHEDPVLNDATLQCGENIGRTLEALNYGVVKAGTSVFYANGASRAAVNTALSLTKQRAVTRNLAAQKAMKITKILAPSTNYETRAVEASYLAMAHTDCESDIRNMPRFVPVAEYGSRKPVCMEECGSVEDVRYILSADLGPFQAAGSATLNGMVADDSTNVDVYPYLYFGREAWGTVALRGKGAVEPSIIPASQKTKDDPLGQRGYVGWKTYHAAVVLNENWQARLEAGVTAL
jgi:N4-gp56 family major capsid protein